MLEICEMLSYKKFKGGETILEFGEQNDVLYIIIDGKVDFTVDTKENPIQDKDVIKVAEDLCIQP